MCRDVQFSYGELMVILVAYTVCSWDWSRATEALVLCCVLLCKWRAKACLVLVPVAVLCGAGRLAIQSGCGAVSQKQQPLNTCWIYQNPTFRPVECLTLIKKWCSGYMLVETFHCVFERIDSPVSVTVTSRLLSVWGVWVSELPSTRADG